ncbi:histone H2B.3 [Ziziphus jujuba]|uniref:Histone H2B.3 n=2 Tax=Ziziphus jujuba TaxID=326968 RepID=A0A6P3Z8R6_ZIZJJ|nr:histone H2B.3 [Ziziphus jujuba]KAH7542079.1 hypothetical protein FEM48_Zijuj02G0035300 [Ziziphus jujuba var. spinosa]
MAPKRAAKVVALKTTKKVVQQTKVQVAVVQTPEKQEQDKLVKSIPVEQKSPQEEEETQTQTTGEAVQKQAPKEPTTTTDREVEMEMSTPVDQKPPHEEEEEEEEEEQTQTQNTGEDVQKEVPKEDITTTPSQEKQEAEKNNTGKKRLRPRRGSGKRRFEGGDQGMGYRRYVFRVLKQVHPGMAISSKAMTIINNLMTDMFERLAEEACRLSKYTGRMTLTSREIQDAVKLVLPGELGRHAIAEGTKAVTNYMSNNHTGGDPNNS